MKEQKELIEAALALAEDILKFPELRSQEREMELVDAAQAYRQAQKEERRESQPRKAPWTDSQGNELFEGDILRYPNADDVEIVLAMEPLWQAKNKDGTFSTLYFATGSGAVKVPK